MRAMFARSINNDITGGAAVVMYVITVLSTVATLGCYLWTGKVGGDLLILEGMWLGISLTLFLAGGLKER